uniref:Uncharacterized protein n=1 Tax=Anguilla anguilla TaxID=7936 RepID=A0A0E9R141_ANGAN
MLSSVPFHNLFKQGRSSCNQLKLLANLCETIKNQGCRRQNSVHSNTNT